MASRLAEVFNDGPDRVIGKVIGIYAVLITANISTWIWASYAFRGHPLQITTAMLAYTLGLRHAVDADHIAAIDNVTRKLMQEGKRPIAVGFFFSLGHSTIVILACIAIAIAATATAFGGRMKALYTVGGMIGTLVSATFLFAIAIMNMFVLAAIHRRYRRVKAGGVHNDDDLDLLLTERGALARILRPLSRMITRSWQMYPLGFLFGLGFDTASEVGLLGISAASASHNLSIWSILVFPALFTVGMSLVDTTDGVLMLGAYGWAYVKPTGKFCYNMAITSMSIVIALVVGSLETMNLIGDRLQLKGSLWNAIGAINGNMGMFGFVITAMIVVAWTVSYLAYRSRGGEGLEAVRTKP